MKKILSTIHAAILLTILGGNMLMSSCSDEYSGELVASLEPLTVEIDNEDIEFNFNGGSKTVSVKSELNWTAKTNDAWIDVSPSSGKNASLTISVAPNNAKTERKGRVDVGSKTITVKQGAEILNVSSKVVSIPESGGSIALNIESNTSWTISQKKDWFTVSTTQGSGSATVNISADKNDGTIRDGQLHVETSDGLFKETVEVEQSGSGVTVVNDIAQFGKDGGSVAYSPSKLVSSNWKATVEAGTTWIHVSPVQGDSNSTLSISVDKTTSTIDRSSYVELTYDNGARYHLIISQLGAGILCGTARYNFFAKGGKSEEIFVESTGEVSVKQDATWFQTMWYDDYYPAGEQDVYTIGNWDYSVGWWQAFSKYYQIPQGKVWNCVFNLNINPNATAVYQNFALVISNDKDRGENGYQEYGALRFDHLPSGNSEWGDYIHRDAVTSTLTFANDTDPGIEYLNGCVVLTIDRTDGGLIVTMTNGIVTKTYKHPGILENLNSDVSNETIRAYLVPERSFIDFLQSNIEPIGGYTTAHSKQSFATNTEGRSNQTSLIIFAKENISPEKRQGTITLSLVGSDNIVNIEVYQAGQHGEFIINDYDTDIDLYPLKKNE